jgi:Nuclease-related domain
MVTASRPTRAGPPTGTIGTAPSDKESAARFRRSANPAPPFRSSERFGKKEEHRVEADREWREKVKAEHPFVGRIATALTPKAQMRPEPQHVRSWAAGAPGEARVGEILEGLEGVVALHDRRIPGRRRNIDHIAITPAGVWVIDAKRYVDSKVEFRDTGGMFCCDERLMVGGRDRTRLVDDMAWQVQSVFNAVDGLLDEKVVRPALCFVEATWPLMTRRPSLVRGVAICWPLSLPGLLSRPGPFNDSMIQRVATAISSNLPSA